MAVSFNYIPGNIRVPLFYAEVSNELAGYFQINQPACLMGPITTSGAGSPTLNVPIPVSDASQAAQQFGAGSVLADMVATYRLNDSFGELWCIPVDSGTGAAAATGKVSFTGSPTSSGNVSLYIGGDLVRVGVSVGQTPTQIATAVTAAIAALPFIAVTAVAATGDVNLTTKAKGTLVNELDLSINYYGYPAGEVTPPGLGIALTPFAGGAGTPDLTAAFAALGDDVYDFIGIPFTDTANLNVAQTAMNDATGRWAWSRQVYGHVFACKSDTFANLQAFGVLRNDQHMSILAAADSPTPTWRRAAALTAEAAVGLRNDPARPLQTLPLLGCIAPPRSQKFTLGQSNSLLYAGLAIEDQVVGQPRIARCATTYQKNFWGQPDPSYLDVTTMATLAYFIRFLRNRVTQKFPRSKLADDGTPFGPGQAIVTPRIIKAELIACYSEMETTGIVENMDAFKRGLIVERDQNDPNRVNVLATPDLINQLRILAVKVAFMLQAPQPVAAAA